MPKQSTSLSRHQTRPYRRRFRSREEAEPRHPYLHRQTGLNLDVFADELYFCHRIPFKDRLDLDSPTICTTDLLLEKMQIVEINLKDFKDTIVLMLEHPLTHHQPGEKSIDVDYISDIMR